MNRNYGIDLLRMVLMYMICLLHTLTLGQGGILETSDVDSLKHNTYWFIEVFSFCAVDGFALISGYMATEKPQKYSKIINLWFQIFFYSFIFTLILTLLGINDSWTLKDIIKCLFPITFNKFWYFTAYFGLFFMMPVLNKFLFHIDDVTAKRTLILFVILFSVMSFVTDPFKLQHGYSAFWLIVLYCVGALSKRIKLFENNKTKNLILLWAICIILTWGVKVFLGKANLVSYLSPTILLSAMLMVVIFSRIKVNGKVVSKISPLVFGIYLFHLNQVIWSAIKNLFAFIVSMNYFAGVLCVCAIALAIFIAGLLVEFLRQRLA